MTDTSFIVHSVYEFEVQWGDCDPADIVYYPNYYRWFDNASHRMFTSHGLGLQILEERFGALGFPLVNAEARFIRPSTVADPMRIESRVSAFSEKTVTVDHAVLRNGELLVTGREIRIFGARKPGGGVIAMPIPDAIRSEFGF